MKTLDRLLSDNNFVRSLIDSLPCGLLIVDSQSRVQAVNNVFESILGINKQAVLGKGPGDALRCLHVSDHPGGCGFGENCGQCDARQLVLTAVSARQKQRKKVYLEVLVDGPELVGSAVGVVPGVGIGDASGEYCVQRSRCLISV